MSRDAGPRYGSRGRLHATDTGVRRVAPTFGKPHFGTYSVKTASGDFAVEGEPEQVVADVLTLDPGVRRFLGQPFTVDLIDRRILRTPEQRAEARQRHRDIPGPRFYTPDFVADCFDKPQIAIEVKAEGYEGNAEYERKLADAQALLEASGYRFLRVVIPSNPWHPLRINLGLLTLATLRTDLWPSPDQTRALVAACGEEGRPLGQVCKALGFSACLAPSWFVRGVFTADLLRCSINFDLQVYPAHGDLSHLALLEELAK